MWDKIRDWLIDMLDVFNRVLDGVAVTLENIWFDLKYGLRGSLWFGEALGHLVLPAAVAVVLLLVCGQARADDRVIVHTVSEHSGSGQYVERNWGVGVELDAGPRSTCDHHALGALRNSQDNPSVYAACAWTLGRAGPVSWQGMAGLIAGYTSLESSATEAGILPLAGVSTRVDLPGPVDPDVLVVPTQYRDDRGGVDLGVVYLLSLTTRF